MKKHFFLLMMLGFGQANAQIFSFDTFLGFVLEHHPVIKQAALLPDEARAEVMMARGAFDPKWNTEFNDKTLNGKHYYNHWDNSIKLPTRTGIDFKVGYERNTGQFVSGDNFTPNNGLVYAGLSVPLAQNLLIDARRAALRQAEFLQNINEAERTKLIIKALFDVSKIYWDWYYAYQQFRLTNDGLRLAEARYRAVKRRVEIGDLPGIDSTQAVITLQERQASYQQALLEWQNAGLVTENQLWDANKNPVGLPQGAIPGGLTLPEIGQTQLDSLMEVTRQNHPELQKVRFKIRQLQVEERFRKNQLLPELNVHYNFMRVPDNRTVGDGFGWALRNSNKIGLDLAFPLLFRKERGKLQSVRIKQNFTELERQQITRDLLMEVRQAYNAVQAMKQQLDLQEVATRNQQLLVAGEQRRYDLGESNLFFVNAQENKLIEMQIKVESLRAKLAKNYAEIRYRAGGY